MSYHLAFGSALDLDKITEDVRAGNRPRHVMWDVRQQLDATVHRPDSAMIQPIDRLRATLISQPEHWALARQIADRLGRDDVIYCNGEDIGIPVAVLCRGRGINRPKIICFFHTANRPRVQMMLFCLRDTIDIFVSNTASQLAQLRRTLGPIDKDRLFYLVEQTDTDFFCPGPASHKPRPVIASVGLEKRDYRILAQATAQMDLDVCISGFSKDVKALAKSFPRTLPANMSRRFYSWQDLAQLYRDADIVVVSLFESKDSAGITTLLEAMACGRPVIATQTKGLADYLQTPGTVIPLETGDVNGLGTAIAHLLQHPGDAKIQGERAYQLATSRHNSKTYIETLTALIRSVG